MKNLLIHSCLVLMILGSFGVGHLAFAEEAAGTPAGATKAATDPTKKETKPVATDEKGVMAWVGGQLFDGMSWVVKGVALGLLSFFAWILAMTGLLLNISVQYLVVGMGEMVLKGGFGVPIDTLWTLIRNLVNISFIFALIYIGITTIIDSHASHAKSLLISVIISALLVNFSLFFAKATIDVSNILADAIYHKMVPDARLANVQTGISAAFMDKLGIAPLMVSPENPNAQKRMELMMQDKQGGVGFTILYALGSSILMFKLAFAFGIGALLLIVRFVTLIFLMILSPIAFLPEMLPGLGGYRKKWMSALISQSFLAPVYLFGLYVVLLILQSTPIHTGSDGLANLFPAGGSGAGTIAGIQMLLYFVIAIVLIVGVTAMAKSMASAGASGLGKAVGVADGFVKGTLNATMKRPAAWAGTKVASGALNATASAGRNTLGRWNQNLSRNAKLNALATNKNSFFGRHFAEATLSSAEVVAKQNFDLRNLSGVQAITKATGIDLGKASKDDFKAALHHEEEAQLKHAEKRNTDESPETKAITKELNGALTEEQDKLRNSMKQLRELEKALGDISQEILEAEMSGESTEDASRRAAGYRTTIESKKREMAEQKRRVSMFREELAEHKKVVTEEKSKNQKAYAELIEAGHFGTGRSFLPFRTKHDNHHIADHIRDSINKKKNETDNDRLMKEIGKIAKGGGDSHGGSGGGATVVHAPEAPAETPSPPAPGGDAHGH